MIYPSPWRMGTFCDTIALLRRVLRPFGGAENRFIRTLVKIHNLRVRRYVQRRSIVSVLLILPRCLKSSDCRAKVQTSLSECTTCTRCPLGRVARMTSRFPVRALVAYRSHLAFAMARDEKPDLILATACHDRLVKALCSVPEVPTLLVPLLAGHENCRDAQFESEWFERQLQRICGPAADAYPGSANVDEPPTGEPVATATLSAATGSPAAADPASGSVVTPAQRP